MILMSEGPFDISCRYYAPSAKWITYYGKPINHIEEIRDLLNDLTKENRELKIRERRLWKENQEYEKLYHYTEEIYQFTNLDLDLLKKEGTGYRYDVYNVTVGKLLEDNRGLRKEAMDSLNELIILKRQHDILVTPEEMVRMEYLKERYEYYG